MQSLLQEDAKCFQTPSISLHPAFKRNSVSEPLEHSGVLWFWAAFENPADPPLASSLAALIPKSSLLSHPVRCNMEFYSGKSHEKNYHLTRTKPVQDLPEPQPGAAQGGSTSKGGTALLKKSTRTFDIKVNIPIHFKAASSPCPYTPSPAPLSCGF